MSKEDALDIAYPKGSGEIYGAVEDNRNPVSSIIDGGVRHVFVIGLWLNGTTRYRSMRLLPSNSFIGYGSSLVQWKRLKWVIVERSIAVCHVFAIVTVFDESVLLENRPRPTLLDQRPAQIPKLEKQCPSDTGTAVDLFGCSFELSTCHEGSLRLEVFCNARKYCLLNPP